MKNLYKLTSEEKIRGIFKTAETASDNSAEDLNSKIMEIKLPKIGNFDFNNETVKNKIAGLALTLGLNSGMFDALGEIFGNLDASVSDESSDADVKTDNKENHEAGNEIIGPLEKDQMRGEEAFKLLMENPNISITSSQYHVVRPPFLPRNTPGSTSLDGIKKRTILGTSFIQEKLGIPIVITGGTETCAHSPSGGHHQGEKVDISFKNGVEEKMDQYLVEKDSNPEKTKIGKKYEFEEGGYKYSVIKESNHFDIKVA